MRKKLQLFCKKAFNSSIIFGKFCAKITKYQHFTSNVDKLLGYRKQKNINSKDIGSIVANISELTATDNH